VFARLSTFLFSFFEGVSSQSRSDLDPDDALARENGRLIARRLELKKAQALAAIRGAPIEEALLWTVRHAIYWLSIVCSTECSIPVTEFADGPLQRALET
jgi:hypothetical protein